MSEILNLEQQKELVSKILRDDYNMNAQIADVKRITDEDLLFEIANSLKIGWRAAAEAIDKISNDEQLLEIVTNKGFSADDHRIEFALTKISDEDILKELYYKADRDIRKTMILEKITDIDFLFDVIKNEQSCQVKSRIVALVLDINKEEGIKRLKELNDSWVNFQLFFIELDI